MRALHRAAGPIEEGRGTNPWDAMSDTMPTEQKFAWAEPALAQSPWVDKLQSLDNGFQRTMVAGHATDDELL